MTGNNNNFDMGQLKALGGEMTQEMGSRGGGWVGQADDKGDDSDQSKNLQTTGDEIKGKKIKAFVLAMDEPTRFRYSKTNLH